MNELNLITSNKGDKKKEIINLATFRDRKKQNTISVFVPKGTKAKTETGYGYKMVGENKIILAPLSGIEAIVIESPTLSSQIETSPKLKRLAKILKTIPIAEIRRIGIDILDE